jgi:hypothetical protein
MPSKTGPVDTIIKSINKCILAYSSFGNNFLLAPLANNELFTYGRGQQNLSEDFLSTILGITGQNLLKICWEDLVTDEKYLLDIESLRRKFSFNVTRETYIILRQAYTNARKKYYKEGEPCEPFSAFLDRKKAKGISKHIRKFLEYDKKLVLLNTKQISKFGETIGCNADPDNDGYKKYLLSAWAFSYFPVEIRNFLYKYHGNKLMINARVSKFRPEISAECSFCVKKKLLPAPKETILHLFWECESVSLIIESLLKKYLSADPERKMFFTGRTGTDNFCKYTMIFCDVVKYSIWECRWQKKIPVLSEIENRTRFFWTLLGSVKKDFFTNVNNTNNFLPVQR